MEILMRTLASIATVTVLAATLAACGTTDPYGANNYPASTVSTAPTYSTTYPNTVATNTVVEYGRVANIEMIAANTQPKDHTLGTIAGGVVGAALGSTIGGGTGRVAATILGAVGGAVVGNKIAQNRDGTYASNVYRISVQTDNGTWRSYDVAATGDLHVGDRVR